LYWHQISFVLLLYGQRIDTHLTDPPLGTDRGFPLSSLGRMQVVDVDVDATRQQHVQ